MTKEEIIEMAHKSGIHLATDVNWMPIIGLEYLEKFAKLVAEKEGEECAKIADEPWQGSPKAIAELIRTRGKSNG